jgi:hypothetical protein
LAYSAKLEARQECDHLKPHFSIARESRRTEK